MVGILFSILAVAHWSFSIIGIALLGWGIYNSSKDVSKLKYLNISGSSS